MGNLFGRGAQEDEAARKADIERRLSGKSQTDKCAPRIRGRWRRYVNRNLAIGSGIGLILALCAFLAPFVAPAHPLAQDLSQRLQPPIGIGNGSRAHLLGTDEFGRDLFSRLLFGARISLSVSGAAVLLAGVVGVVLGVIAGHAGGKVESVILQVADVQLALPPVLLAIIVVATLGNTLLNLIVVLAIGAWVIVARIAHSSIRALESREFVIAAQALGAGPGRMMFQHLLRNAWTPIIVICTLQLARTFIIEASLSFLGLGIPAPAPAWGTMLSDSRSYLFVNPWLAIFPGIAIVVTVLAINMLGDGLSEALDPKLRML